MMAISSRMEYIWIANWRLSEAPRNLPFSVSRIWKEPQISWNAMAFKLDARSFMQKFSINFSSSAMQTSTLINQSE